MVRKNAKKTVLSEKALNFPEEPNIDEQNNAPNLRRSKRNAQASAKLYQSEVPKESKDLTDPKNVKLKSSKRTSKSKKGSTVNKKVSVEPSVLNQTTILSFISNELKPRENSESSESIPCSDTINEEHPTIRVFKSVSEEASDLCTGGYPSEAYWKLMAEKRQAALEVTLYETAQIRDRLEVLATENGRLKDAIEEGEKVLQIVNDCL